MKEVNEIMGMFAKCDTVVVDGVETTVEVGYDLKGLDELIAKLRTARKDKAIALKQSEKAKYDENREDLAKAGKEYYDSLPNGAAFQYKDSKGKVWDAVKIETASKSGKSAACERADGKRYPSFDQVIIPTEEVEE